MKSDLFACYGCGKEQEITDATVVLMEDDALEKAKETKSKEIPAMLACPEYPHCVATTN